MPSFTSSGGAALATAVVVSGTVILMVCRRKRIFRIAHLEAEAGSLRSCISSGTGKKETKSKKRVRFAHDVLKPSGDNEESRRKHTLALKLRYESQAGDQDRAISVKQEKPTKEVYRKVRNMPENQVVLYNGILRDRIRRMATSY